MQKDMSTHLNLFCIDRLLYCTLGCGEMMKQEFMENHTLFFCKNKNFRYQAVVKCPNGCGESMMKREVRRHMLMLIDCLQCPTPSFAKGPRTCQL